MNVTTKSEETLTTSGNNVLPVFTEVIKVEVEVNSIFKRLLAEFPEDYKHRDNVAHAIIGSAQVNGGLGYIYNALSGFNNNIDFKETDSVICSALGKYQWYDANIEDENGELISAQNLIKENTDGYKPNWKKRKVAIGKCTITEINLYKANKVRVMFLGGPSYSYGPEEVQQEWVDHKTCKQWNLETVA